MTALPGVGVGLLWQAISPSIRYVVVDGRPILADPESQSLISTDGRFAILTALGGLLCGMVAYLAAGRGTDIAIVTGLALGGIVATVLAWRVGHQIGLDAFQHAVHGARDGVFVTGVADLRATGVLVFWPLVAVGVFGLSETMDMAGRHRADRGPELAPGDGGEPGGGKPDQVGGDELDLQATPTGGNEDGREG
ncbi:MAG TPA: hypothetical protein VF069_25445 [Streptosporangiaceae bacterium]